jgi:hypothetical protein
MAAGTQVTFARQIELRHEVDVFVAGGGPAGLAAAVAAARQGARVFLVEGQACFGGSGTAGGLPMFCNFADGVHFLAGGVGREVLDRLTKAGGLGPTVTPENIHDFIVYRGEILKRVYDEMVTDSGAGFSFLTQCVAVEAQAGRIERAICWGKSGLFAVQAKVYVDCTGDGDLCAWAGAPFEKGDPAGRMQPPTLCSVWADVDWAKAEAAGCGIWQAERRVGKAVDDGLFTVPDRHLPGMLPIGPHAAGGNIGHAFGTDGTDERSLTQGLMWGRKVLTEYERFYKTCLQGFEKMELVGTGAILGIRETRRIMGDYVLNVDDFQRRASFADEIGRYCYWVDMHETQPGTPGMDDQKQQGKVLRLGKGESYGIPYRCLTPRGLANVLVAGRCVSTDRSMQGSLRVMPGCFITGQAAGVAAALAAGQGADVRAVAVAELRQRLKSLGAYLPNA